jgi:hypothetical protein
MARTKANERKTVEIARKRIPMKKLLHGKEIREAAKSLEEFRLQFKEQEFLYGGKITVQVDSYGETTAVVHRMETDKEFEDRLEKARIAAELKKERERKRREQEAIKAKELEFRRRASNIERMRSLAKELGLSQKDLVDILDR